MKRTFNTLEVCCWIYVVLGTLAHKLLPHVYSIEFGIVMLIWCSVYIFLCYRFKMNLYNYKPVWKMLEIIMLVVTPIAQIVLAVLRFVNRTDPLYI